MDNEKLINALEIAENTLAAMYRVQYKLGISKVADGPDNRILKIVRDALAESKDTREECGGRVRQISVVGYNPIGECTKCGGRKMGVAGKLEPICGNLFETKL